MSGFYTVGEKKDRPGVYHRIENAGGVETAGAREGIGCAVVSGNWGALNTPVTIDPSIDVATVIGSGSGATVVNEAFAGGVSELVVVRVGTGGTQSAITLKDNASSGVDVVTLTALYPGSRAFSITVKSSLDDETLKEATIYEGTKKLESVTFEAGSKEVDEIVAAFASSSYVKATKKAEGSGILADVQQKAFTPGTDPTVDTEAYSAGFTAAEPETKDMILVDSNEPAVHNLLATYIDRIYQDGEYPMACVAEESKVALATRQQHAAAFNNEKVVYVLNSWVDTSGEVYEGYRAAARIGGMICSGSASVSLTHTVISGAAGLNEGLTNAQIKKALKSGCLVLSLSKTKQVQIEKAINTLVTLDADQDAGWKKIRRVKERFELMDRIDTTLEPMIGAVDNDADGRAAVIAAAQTVVDAMIGEKKLLSGTVIEDEANPAEGDSAWFIIAVDDLDSIETIYLTYRFRFAAEAEE
jgi:hypothetical protein